LIIITLVIRSDSALKLQPFLRTQHFADFTDIAGFSALVVKR